MLDVLGGGPQHVGQGLRAEAHQGPDGAVTDAAWRDVDSIIDETLRQRIAQALH